MPFEEAAGGDGAFAARTVGLGRGVVLPTLVRQVAFSGARAPRAGRRWRRAGRARALGRGGGPIWVGGFWKYMGGIRKVGGGKPAALPASSTGALPLKCTTLRRPPVSFSLLGSVDQMRCWTR